MKGESVLSGVKKILSHFKKFRFLLVLDGLFILINTGASIGVYYLLKFVVDEVLFAKDLQKFAVISGYVVVLKLMEGTFFFAKEYLTAYMGNRVVFELREKLFSHLQSLSLSFFQGKRRGELISNLTNDLNVLTDFFNVGLRDMFTLPVIFLLSLGYVFFLSWQLTLFSLILFPGVGLVIKKSGERMRKLTFLLQAKLGDITAKIEEGIRAVRETQIYGNRKYMERWFRRANEEGFRYSLHTVALRAVTVPILDLVGALSVLAIIGAGLMVMKLNPSFTPGDFTVFMVVLTGRVYDSVKKFGSFYLTLQRAVAAYHRIEESILRFSAEVDENSNGYSPPPERVKGKVVFDDVRFSYDGDKEVLKGISFVVEPGEFVGIVGRSGEGKSTILNLIARFYDVTGGAVLIDGVDVRDYRLSSLRSLIGLVPQEIFIFNTTVAQNIRFGKLDATDDEVERAAEMAGVTEFLREKGWNLQHLIEEEGKNLSGGQRQRIALARALLKRPKILLLDEATSSLDSESERKLVDTVLSLKENMTIIFVSHRVAPLKCADRIVVLNGGKIVVMGKYEELKTRSDYFNVMVTHQSV